MEKTSKKFQGCMNKLLDVLDFVTWMNLQRSFFFEKVKLIWVLVSKSWDDYSIYHYLTDLKILKEQGTQSEKLKLFRIHLYLGFLDKS